MMNLKKLSLALLVGLLVASSAGAAEVLVNSNINQDTTWTADNTYNLQTTIYVENGATLTIEPGVVIASDPNDAAALVITTGSQIFANGTADAPIIFTSKADVATWSADPSHPTAKDPKTGTWRAASEEWGNLTILGKGIIGYDLEAGDTSTPGGSDAQMEGLVAQTGDGGRTLYGGNDDNDDSGSLSYVSLRYGGRLIGDKVELNGLSLGGVGRETEISHIEIMNNLDDGIEIWGGTVNLKYVSIWNIGDDSFDLDQGWRGKAQFGLIVQGYSGGTKSGSGIGDNAFETDGAEWGDAQPVTTAKIYNFTVIGNPLASDHGTAWRDNARMQYRNCIFMDLGEELVKNDDNENGGGYGVGGTLGFAAMWTTPAGTHSAINAGGYDLNALYQAQTDGFLAEITDSVFYNNLFAGAYSKSDDVGVTVAGGSNPAKNNVVATSSPIQSISRETEMAGTTPVSRVTSLNPCAANDAATSAKAAPADGFFTPVQFRGAFSATNNWLAGWTAADAYGFVQLPAQQVTGDPNYVPQPSPTAELAVTTTVTFEDEAGVTYTIEKSGDMKTWTPVETIVGDGGTASVNITGPLADQKFYRVVKQ